MNIAQSLQQAKNQLASCADNAALEAELLLAHVLNKSRSFLHAWPEQMLTTDQAKQLNDYINRRRNKEPIAYIIERREFWSLDLQVTPETLIPRPETELLVESALKLADANKPIQCADLGTGSGAIALALAHERPHWQVHATDVSQKALQIASKNAQRLGIENISFYLGNWCTALPCGNFDLIVSNPPYIAETEWEEYAAGLVFEPRSALVSGLDGLEAIRTISSSAKSHLKPGGYLLIEHGFLQGPTVRAIFAAEGYQAVRSVCDLSGKERITIGCIFKNLDYN